MKNMRSMTAVLLALVLLFTTGCSYLPEDIAAVVEEEANSFKEDFKNEVVDAIKEEIAITSSRVEENSETGTSEDNSSSEDEEENILTPTIGYRGITYTPHMTITDEQLYEWIPDLEYKDTSEYSLSRNYSLGSLDSPYLICNRSWEEFHSTPERKVFSNQLYYGEWWKRDARYLSCFSIKKEGASSNGVYIGDPVENVLKIFPLLIDDTQETDSLEVYFYEGEVLSYDQYCELSSERVTPRLAGHELEIDFKYNVSVLSFNIKDGNVCRITICDNLWYMLSI